MKSIIQEASSIAKAIEEGWIKAQKPQQFSVKILEEAEKNFLGMTKKSAKVALFFDEPQLNKPSMQTSGAHEQNRRNADRNAGHSQTSARQSNYAKPGQASQSERFSGQQQHPRQQSSQPVVRPSKLPGSETGSVKKQFEPLWNQAMVDRSREWMDEALKNSNNSQVTFTIEPQKFHLRITLSHAILNDPDKEKQLLASFSALILETLKRTFKMSLRGHKIVLTHQPK